MTGDFKPHHKFLSDETYALALDSIVKACSDVLIVRPSDDHFYLGKRKVEPQPDWWFIGGRSKPGDTTIDAAVRNVKRELGLSFEQSRFRVIATYSFAWEKRQQAPQTNGTADISVIHALVLRDDEVSKIVLDENEYDDAQWWSADDILTGAFHPALKQAVLDWRLARETDQLRDTVASRSDNWGVIAGAAKSFIKVMDEACGAQRTNVSFSNGVYDVSADGKKTHFDTTPTKPTVPSSPGNRSGFGLAALALGSLLASGAIGFGVGRFLRR